MNIKTDIHIETSISTVQGIQSIPFHKIPHIYLGSLGYFEDCKIYVFFPFLYATDRESSFITDSEYERFINVLLEEISKVYDSGILQHLPSSFQDARAKGRATGKERGVQVDKGEAKIQMLHYMLLGDCLPVVWEGVLRRLRAPGFRDLRKPILLLNAKNLKTMFRSSDPRKLVQQFLEAWKGAIDATYLLPQQTWIDIGKEVVASQTGVYATTFLWKQCCLVHTLKEFKLNCPKSGFRENFYPWALTQDTCNMTFMPGKRHPLAFMGLVYSQFYSSTKEMFDVAKTYPFQDTSLEGLAIDAKLWQLWRKDSGNTGANWCRERIQKAYLSAKERVNIALEASTEKCYGTREEHRMTWTLFTQVGNQIQNLNLDSTPSYLDKYNPPFRLIKTKHITQFLYSNILKFGYGFEYCINKDGGSYISPESTKMATMFLHLLRVSLGGALLVANSALWIDQGIYYMLVVIYRYKNLLINIFK